MEINREKRHSFEDLIYSQDRLTEAINEAKSINVLVEQTRMKMKQLKTNLEQKTLPTFLSLQVQEERQILEKRMNEEVKGTKKALSEQIEKASSLGSNHKYVQRAMFI